MKKVKNLFKRIGPGFITGAADDDPSGIGTYSQTGAFFGLQQLWTPFFSLPFMTVVQEMCGRIGLVTGKGLSGVMKKYYSKKIVAICILLLLIANTVNIGANLGAMASSLQLLIPIPFVLGLIIFSLVTLLLEVFIPYPTYSKYLKYFSISLLAYILVAFMVSIEWKNVLKAIIIPQINFSKIYIMNIVAIFGTTISPYLFFWQSDEEVEEEVAHHKIKAMGKGIPKISIRDVRNMRIDTLFGMFMSNVIMFFIILTSASTLHLSGIFQIETASQAAEALRPIAGNLTFVLFSAGIIGTGLLAIPVLAGSAAYAVSELAGWREGLSQPFKRAHGFYGVIISATLIGVIINFTPIQPFQMLYYTAILNGIIAPPLIFMVLFICNNKQIMGKYTNGVLSNIMGFSIAIFMSLCALFLIFAFFM